MLVGGCQESRGSDEVPLDSIGSKRTDWLGEAVEPTRFSACKAECVQEPCPARDRHSAKRALGRFLGGGEPDYADSIAGRRDSVEVRTRSNTPAMPAIPAALGCSG